MVCFLLNACALDVSQSSGTPSAAITFPTTALTPVPTTTVEPVEIRWLIGLSTGTSDDQVAVLQQVASDFNARQSQIRLQVMVEHNAAENLDIAITAGASHWDVAGPVSNAGMHAFEDAWLDLQSLAAANDYDVSQFDDNAIDYCRSRSQSLICLPFAMNPAVFLFNRDLFDAAGLPYPPQVYGRPYADGQTWDIDQLEALSKRLTFDVNGNDATDSNFDPNSITQFGFVPFGVDCWDVAILFGAGSVANTYGHAQIPAHWRTALKWYRDGMFKGHFTPTWLELEAFDNSDPFWTGKAAMTYTRLGYVPAHRNRNINWDNAILPAYKGQVTAPLSADVFAILANTEHPTEAYEVLNYLTGEAAPKLYVIYTDRDGAVMIMPALVKEQDTIIQQLATVYPAVNWQVVSDTLTFARNIDYAPWVPNYTEVYDALATFSREMATNSDWDVDIALGALQMNLQKILDETK